MAFELKQGRSVRKNITRLARKQIDKALGELEGAGGDGSRDKPVHEARKCFKKVRAVLRLVRPVISGSTYRAENKYFRDAGRPLTEVRDAKVLVETLDKLSEHFSEQLRGKAFDDVRQQLLTHQREVRKRVLDEQDAVASVAAKIREARKRVRDWADAPNCWRSLGRGLRDVYRSARQALAEAETEPTLENLHEWRKQAKYLRYQLEIQRPLWPEHLEEIASEADRLGELLGDDHDLAILRQMVTDEPERFGGGTEIQTLLALADRRRAELQHEAFALGRRFFVDKPADFVRPLKAYWRAWRKEAAQPEPVAAPEPA